MVRLDHRDAVHFKYLIAHPEAGQIGRTSLGDARNEDALVVALERRRALAAGYAQPQPGRRPLDVDLELFLLELGEGVGGVLCTVVWETSGS